MSVRILLGDCLDILPTLPAASVQCCVTSPPYFGLRDYGTGTWSGGHPSCDHGLNYRRKRNAPRVTGLDGGTVASERDPIGSVCGCGAMRTDAQIGLEPAPDAYVAKLVSVFAAVRRVMCDDGTLWLNLGDSYAGGGNGGGGSFAINGIRGARLDADKNQATRKGSRGAGDGVKPKDLIGIPWQVAFALRADGWFLRSDIIWHKPNPMPESVTDRPTSAHEHVFMLTKKARYFYDAEAIKEEGVIPAGTLGAKGSAERFAMDGVNSRPPEYKVYDGTRNARNVWTIATQPFSGAHFATMPPELVERCIKAGSKPGDTVLDPFAGAFTTALVADRLRRKAIGIELNPAYCAMAQARIERDAGMFAQVAAQ